MRGDRNEEISQNQPFCVFLTTDGHDLLLKCEDALKKKETGSFL